MAGTWKCFFLANINNNEIGTDSGYYMFILWLLSSEVIFFSEFLAGKVDKELKWNDPWLLWLHTSELGLWFCFFLKSYDVYWKSF